MAYPNKTGRDEIIATAMRQIVDGGIDALTIRGTANEIGIAPNAIYRYFANISDLKGAVSEESRRRLLAALKTASGQKGPTESIRAIAHAYLEYARQNPHSFAVTLLPSNIETDDAAHKQSWLFVSGQVGRLYGAERAAEATVALWALIHGMTVLEHAGVLGSIKPSSGFELGLELWIQGADS